MSEKLIIPPHHFNKLFMKCAEVSSINTGKTIRVGDLMKICRKREIVVPRQWAMFFLKHYTELSLSQIGSMLGDKDHATVLNACKVVNSICQTNKSYDSQVKEIEKFVIDLCTTKKTKFYTYTPAKKHEINLQVEGDQQDYKKIADERLAKIDSMQKRMDEYIEIIQNLRSDLKIAEGQARLYKRKMEYALMPGRILQGE